jgi:hypothetical protein
MAESKALVPLGLEYEARVGTAGSGDLQFNRPSGVSVDHELDRMRVADSKNKRIVVTTLRLKFVRALRGSGRGALWCPTGMAAAPGSCSSSRAPASIFISGSQWPAASSGLSPSSDNTLGRCTDAGASTMATTRRNRARSWLSNLFAAAGLPAAAPICTTDSSTSASVRGLTCARVVGDAGSPSWHTSHTHTHTHISQKTGNPAPGTTDASDTHFALVCPKAPLFFDTGKPKASTR